MTYELERSNGGPIVEEPTESIRIIPGELTDFYSENGFEQEFYFESSNSGLYSVAWFDHWFDDFNAAIHVSAYNSDKSNYYFQNEQLIQNNGAPFPIFVPSAERVNLSVIGKGTYGVKITPLEEDVSNLLTLDTPKDVIMNLGDTQLLYFEVQENKNYEITVGNSVDGGAYDDGAETMISILEEGTEGFSVYKESIPSPCCGGTKSFSVTSEEAKKIYLVINAAYWFKANKVTIEIKEI